MSVRRRRRSARDSRGAAAVEFAIVVPFLLLIVFGIIAYGYSLSFRQAVSQGTSEAARAAAVQYYGNSTSAQIVQNTTIAVNALNQGLNGYGVTCAITTPMSDPKAAIQGGTGSLTRGGTTVGTCSVLQQICSNDSTHQCMSVSVNYDYRNHPLVPVVPGIGLLTPSSLSYTSVSELVSS